MIICVPKFQHKKYPKPIDNKITTMVQNNPPQSIYANTQGTQQYGAPAPSPAGAPPSIYSQSAQTQTPQSAYGTQAPAPSVYTPSAYTPNQGVTTTSNSVYGAQSTAPAPSVYTPSAYTPNQGATTTSTSVYGAQNTAPAPSVYTPSTYTPNQGATTTSTSVYGAQSTAPAPSVYTPSTYTPNQGVTTTSTSVYGAQSTAPAPSVYTPSTYTPNQGVTTTSTSVYGTQSTTQTPATTSIYANTTHKPAQTTGTPTYQPSTPASAAPTSTYSSAPAQAASSSAPQPSAAGYQAPDFSQALDNPAPPQSYTSTVPATVPPMKRDNVASSYGNRGPYGSENPDAISVPTGAASAMNSSTYQGGPTGGLVSEGNPTQCHKVDYEIKGHDMQLVEIELDPTEAVIAEAGAMMFLDDGIDFKAKLGDGSEPKQTFWKKLLSAGGRLLTGESLFITHFTNTGQAKARVAFGAPYPGTIIPINMANIEGKLICQKDAFLCAALGTKLSIHFNRRLGSGFFGGEGFILEKLQGDGMAFIHAGGTVIKRELRGDRIRLDTGCLVAFTDGINYDIQMVPGLKSILFSGEGLFLATLQGHGTVWIQSLPFSRMADRIIQSAPSAGGRRKGEGGPLGGLGGLLDGDGF